MKYLTAIVLAAGKGLRFSRFGISKSLIEINEKPILIYSLEPLSQHPYIRDIIVVANSLNKNAILNRISEYRIKKIKDVILGGKERRDSVRNGLEVIDSHTDLILIHDGVRPFIDKNLVSSVIKEAGKYGAAILGVPVKATIKRVTGYGLRVTGKFIVQKTIDRDNLWEIQTPQVFKKELILGAYKKFGNTDVTDDAMLVEKLGVKVRVVMGSYFNLKITTPEDLVIAEAIAKKLKA